MSSDRFIVSCRSGSDDRVKKFIGGNRFMELKEELGYGYLAVQGAETPVMMLNQFDEVESVEVEAEGTVDV